GGAGGGGGTVSGGPAPRGVDSGHPSTARELPPEIRIEMTVLYRAVWDSSPNNPSAPVTDDVRLAFSRWAANDDAGQALTDGSHRFDQRTVNLRTIVDDDFMGLEGTCIDRERR